LRQARRFDRDGDYVRRYVPELGHIEGGAVHGPWEQAGHDYPARIGDEG
jgi:deoxyribodipyrimidine photo-lyase